MKFTNISKLFTLGAFSIMFAAACTNLEVKETDSILSKSTGGGFVAGDPTALLASAYNDLSLFTNQDNVYSLYEHTSGEMLPPTRGTDWGDNGVWRTLDQHTWDPTHAYVLNAWNDLNSRVYKANQILASSPNKQQTAEAKFLRAFYMWHVMDLWGQVPFRDVTDGVDVNPKVLSRTAAFDFIVKDLNDALPDLPAKGPSATNNTASQAAANALLARLYLNKFVYSGTAADAADMTKVVGYCEAVKAAGYSLESSYFKNFSTSATSEVILTSAAGTPQNRWFMTLHYDQNPSGWNGFVALSDFYNKFEKADQRIGNYPTPSGANFSGIGRGFLVGQQYKDNGQPITNSRNGLPLAFTTDCPLLGASSEKGIRVIKYHPSDAGQYILLRYADVYLMEAEAIQRGGTGVGGATALSLINNLRSTRGASALASVDLNAILDERGRELYWEGWRRTDEVRFGAFDAANPTRNLFPVPQQALDSNPNLKQNTGY
jgi:hypothetical protein